LKMLKLVYAVFTISLMLILVFATPHVYADDETPLRPAALVRFPGYHPVKTTGSPPLPPSMTRSGTRPLAKPSATVTWSNGLTPVCSIPSGRPSGVATGPGGQFIEDWVTGNLWFYKTATKKCTLIQTAPAGATAKGYDGMAVTGTLVALISFDAQGLWTCTLLFAPPFSSGKCKPSAFIPLPSAFCASMPTGHCFPIGIAFDKSKNLWYVDDDNNIEVELTAASHYTTVGTTQGPYGSELIGIAIDSNGNHWVVDATCAGNLYENGVVVASAGDDLESIAISTSNPSHKANIYVLVSNFCGNYAFPFVGDMSDGIILPHPYNSGADDTPGISTLLYFADYAYDQVWVTQDTY